MAPEPRTHGNEQGSLTQITATAFPKDGDRWLQQPDELTTVTLRAAVDDATARVSATVANAAGTNEYWPVVTRAGAVRVADVALAAGTNWVTLRATDAAANVGETSFPIVRGAVSVRMNPLTSAELTWPVVTVSGTVTSEPGLAGQNSPTPAEKIFGNHQVIQYETSAKGSGTGVSPVRWGSHSSETLEKQHAFLDRRDACPTTARLLQRSQYINSQGQLRYYDPSYGRAYTNVPNFHGICLDAIAKPVGTNPPSLALRVQRYQ